MTAPEAPALAPDLELGLRRLKLRTMRSLAPEVLQTAKVQRWAPDELLRTLVDAEVSARDQANEANRRRQAGFPVAKSLDEFKVADSRRPDDECRFAPSGSAGQSLDGAKRAADSDCSLTNGLAFVTHLASLLSLLNGQLPSQGNLRFESTHRR